MKKRTMTLALALLISFVLVPTRANANLTILEEDFDDIALAVSALRNR